MSYRFYPALGWMGLFKHDKLMHRDNRLSFYCLDHILPKYGRSIFLKVHLRIIIGTSVLSEFRQRQTQYQITNKEPANWLPPGGENIHGTLRHVYCDHKMTTWGSFQQDTLHFRWKVVSSLRFGFRLGDGTAFQGHFPLYSQVYPPPQLLWQSLNYHPLAMSTSVRTSCLTVDPPQISTHDYKRRCKKCATVLCPITLWHRISKGVIRRSRIY